MKDIEINEITEKDITQIIDIWYEVSLQAHDFIPSDYWRNNKDQMSDKYIPMSETYQATDGDEILGFISLLDDYLAAIFVKSEFQGKGIGSLLLNHAMNLRNTLELKVFCKNRKSIEFYKSRGFTVISEAKDNETGESELVMKWHK
ncbi:GNAT family N-acetyltransferase [Oceanispirochaeta crateris]|uniref:GNAT family N-acetyltransferase n=1 Tax=Oceanispirochaeta crateris TaxID=2518645 RepID=A0A5C1QPY2_9SPIO|nr:GNAT family N-acetyltransferase [Oceanispirochaeta crateris]QEN08192.1 GNAT family N-acetyltransferase [Oceanispirochaeta crateris]